MALDFTNYDFDDLVAQLTNRLKERDAWKDTYRSSTGQMLIELFGYIGNMVLYYVERRAEESYILTAKNKSSIVNLVRLLNYVPKRKVSAVGTLRFTLTGGINAKMVYIPKYTVCTTTTGMKYMVSEDAVIMPGQLYVDVNGVQGELVTLNRVGNGTPDQEYTIEDNTIENTNIFISVGGAFWTQVTSFIYSTSSSTDYTLKTELNDYVTIVFGNGIFGLAPAVGESIEIKYIKSEGVLGNVYELARIVTMVSTIYDEDETATTVTVSNVTTFLGGDDAETAEEIREEAPKVFATGDRAVTKNDFIAILNNYAGVADSNVWGEKEETPPNYTMYNQVKLCVLLQNWALPDTAFETVLTDYLYEKSLMTVRYSFIDPEIIYVVPTFTIKVIRGSTLSYISSQISTAMDTAFTLGTTTKLGVSKQLSDIVATVEGVSGVSHSYTDLRIRKELSSIYDSLYDWAGTIEAIPVLAGSISVLVNDVEVATDDGLGNFTDISSAYTITGDIDYVTGVIGIDISGSPTVTALVIKYNQDEEGDIVVTKNQICKLYETDIESITYVT